MVYGAGTAQSFFGVSSSTPAFGTFLPFRFFHFFLMFSCLNWRSERIEMGNTSLISSEGSIKGGRIHQSSERPVALPISPPLIVALLVAHFGVDPKPPDPCREEKKIFNAFRQLLERAADG